MHGFPVITAGFLVILVKVSMASPCPVRGVAHRRARPAVHIWISYIL